MKQMIIAGLMVAGFGLHAQDIDVKERKETFSTGSQNALVVTIYENSADDVLDKWKSRLKDFKNEKVKESSGEVYGDNILIKEWGNNPVDIYSRASEDKSARKVELKVAVDIGGGTYLTESSQREKYQYMEKLLKEFAVKASKDAINVQMIAAQKALSKLQDDQKSLEKDNKSLQDDIVNYQNKITKAQSDIKKNESDQVKKKADIEAQSKVVEAVKKKMDGIK